MFIPTTTENSKKLVQYSAHIRDKTANQLVDALGISPLRIPMVNVIYANDGIYLNVLLLDKASAALSFSDTPDFRPTQKDEIMKADGIEECAKELLADNKKPSSFIYCLDDSVAKCYTMRRSLTDQEAGKPIPSKELAEDAICSLYTRTAQNTLGAELLNEPELEKAGDDLVELVKNGELTIPMKEKVNDKDLQEDLLVKDIRQGTNSEDIGNNLRTFERTMEQTMIKEDSETSKKPETDKMTSLGDCYNACRDEISLVCQTFSYCRKNGQTTCILSSLPISDKMEEKERKANTMVDTSCSVYTRNYLVRFTQMKGFASLTPGGTVSQTASTPQECAKECTYKKDGKCESFEFCNDKTCILREEHWLELKSADKDKIKKDSKCSIYSCK